MPKSQNASKSLCFSSIKWSTMISFIVIFLVYPYCTYSLGRWSRDLSENCLNLKPNRDCECSLVREVKLERKREKVSLQVTYSKDRNETKTGREMRSSTKQNIAHLNCLRRNFCKIIKWKVLTTFTQLVNALQCKKGQVGFGTSDWHESKWWFFWKGASSFYSASQSKGG